MTAAFLCMQFTVSEPPGSVLHLDLEPGERILAEAGTLLLADGRYAVELRDLDVRTAFAALFGQKLGYTLYTAESPLRLMLAPTSPVEIFGIGLAEGEHVRIRPKIHLARQPSVELAPVRSGVSAKINTGTWMRASGPGHVFLTGRGSIVSQRLDGSRRIVVGEEALVAFDETLEVSGLDAGLKDVVRTGQEPLVLEGAGRIWLQTRGQETILAAVKR